MVGDCFAGAIFMHVTRTDLYDFKVELTLDEFALVKSISDCDGIGIEQAFANAVETGLYEAEQESQEGS